MNITGKANISTKVSTEVADRFVSALTDALSPFTESMGLIGDHVRAHRYDVAIRIIEKAKLIADARNFVIKPPPLKFTVPFIEKASIEEDDEVLMEMWANLLADTSREFHGFHLTFIQILSELNRTEAVYLDAIRSKFLKFEQDSPFAWNDTDIDHEEREFTRLVTTEINKFIGSEKLISSRDASLVIDRLSQIDIPLQCRPISFIVPFHDDAGITTLKRTLDDSIIVYLLQRQSLMSVSRVDFDSKIGRIYADLGVVTSLGKSFLTSCVNGSV